MDETMKYLGELKVWHAYFIRKAVRSGFKGKSWQMACIIGDEINRIIDRS